MVTGIIQEAVTAGAGSITGGGDTRTTTVPAIKSCKALRFLFVSSTMSSPQTQAVCVHCTGLYHEGARSIIRWLSCINESEWYSASVIWSRGEKRAIEVSDAKIKSGKYLRN